MVEKTPEEKPPVAEKTPEVELKVKVRDRSLSESSDSRSRSNSPAEKMVVDKPDNTPQNQEDM